MFGLGCTGTQRSHPLSLTKMRTLILYLFGNYDVALENPNEVKKGDSQIVMKPENGLRVTLKPRINATMRARDAIMANAEA